MNILILFLFFCIIILVSLPEILEFLEENSPEEINIIKEIDNFLIKKTKYNNITYLTKYSDKNPNKSIVFFQDNKSIALKCLTLQEIENHYTDYLNKKIFYHLELIKKLK